MPGILNSFIFAGSIQLPLNIDIEEILSSGTATAGITLNNNGTMTYNPTTGADPDWYVGAPVTDVGDDYQVIFDLTGGSVGTGTVDVWQDLPYTYSNSRGAIGAASGTGTLRIRDKVSLEVLAVADISLLAEIIV